MGQSTIFYTIIMIAAGVGIPVMATMNARLGIGMASPLWASMTLFFVAFLASTLAVFVMGAPVPRAHDLSFLYYFAGLLVVFYVIAVTFIAPHFGIANAIFCVLLGQIVASILIDHFGLFGVVQTDLSWQRVLGAILMVLGIYLARRTG